MAKRFTDLLELTDPADNDVMAVVDVSANATKRVTRSAFLTNAIDTIHIRDDAITPDKQSPIYVGANQTTSTGSIASATFAITNLQLTLPSAGIWVITANVRTSHTGLNEWIEMRLWNNTTGVDADSITGESDWISGLTNASVQHPSSKTIVCVTTTANNVIQLQARRGSTNAAVAITSDANGRTSIVAYRIG